MRQNRQRGKEELREKVKVRQRGKEGFVLGSFMGTSLLKTLSLNKPNSLNFFPMFLFISLRLYLVAYSTTCLLTFVPMCLISTLCPFASFPPCLCALLPHISPNLLQRPIYQQFTISKHSFQFTCRFLFPSTVIL